MQTGTQKAMVRRTALARRARLTADQRAAKGEAVAARLLSLPALAAARSVLAFASFGTEIPTDAVLERLLAAGTRVLLPYVGGDGELQAATVASLDDLVPGYRGIREPRERLPVAAASIEVAVVPGVAFDAAGGRLGYGGGFYDRFLSALPGGVLRAGICFDEQLVEAVPVEPHDERVDVVVTDARVVESRPPRPR